MLWTDDDALDGIANNLIWGQYMYSRCTITLNDHKGPYEHELWDGNQLYSFKVSRT